MRYLKRWQLAFVCLMALLLPPVVPARRTQAQTVTYTVTDLGTLGSASSEANAIDNCGRVVGESPLFANGPPHPFFWSNGQITDIGTFGGDSGGAFGINASATVAGNAATTGNRAHIFTWTAASGKTDIGTLTGGSFATAFDINDSNQLVGVSDISTGGSLGDRGIFWQQSTGIQAIAPFPGGSSSTAYGINNAGQIVGTASGGAFAGTHAFLLNGGVGGTMIDLGTLGNGISNGKDSFATQINESGQVVGYSTLPSPSATVPFHAFLWTQATGMLDINPAGGGNSRALDINDSGQVVGIFEIVPFVNRAFIYTQANGMSDLNNSLAPGSNWILQEARSINERGQIVGVGINPNGATRAFLLTPSNFSGNLQFSNASYSVSESGTKATITVTRTGGAAGTVTVNYATSDGTASASNNDYQAASGTLTFDDGETSKTFDVNINNDSVVEPNETVGLTLSSPTGGASLLCGQGAATLTITNDDTAPGTIQFNPTTYNINEGDGTANITVTRTGGSDGAVSVSFSTASGGTATAGDDYIAVASQTVSFANGDAADKIVTVSINNDSVQEGSETINLSLSNPTGGATLGTPNNTAVVTINDNDAVPSFAISDVTLAEGNTGTTAFVFTVSKTGATTVASSVNFSTADGTATAGQDYAAITSTALPFAAGDTSKTITVNVNGDTTFEPNETFFVNLSTGTNAVISDNQATGTITNDDASPGTLQFSSATYNVNEGAAPNTATITVTRTGGSGGAVSVNYATSDGSATAGQDYAANSNILSFANGETSKTFNVSITNDTIDETDETVNLTLSNPTGGASIGTQSTAVLTITDNDDSPSFSIGDVTLAEGNTGTTAFTFTVTKNGSTALTSSVGFATADGAATITGNDYQSNNGTLTFAANETSKQITVLVTGDTTPEANETFFVNLSGATNATISDNQATGTISNDDASLSISDVTVVEGNSGTVNAAFNVTIPFATVNIVTVNFATADGTATVAGGDYANNSGTLTFNPGETTKPVNVTVNGDTLDEINETFAVNLSGATGATISDNQAQGTITDDDATPSLSIGDATVTEGNGGTVNAAFVVTLSAASGQTVTASFGTADGSATTADNDYQPITSPTPLTFVPGVTQQTIEVQVNGDAKFENDETFFVNLTGATNASIPSNDSQGLGTIRNDDSQPSFTINDVGPLAEGNAATTAFTFTVTKSGETAFASSVGFATADGTAQDDNPASEDNDYQATSGTLTFAANETTKQITVNVVGDTTDEANETFFVNLSGATGATINDAQGQGTITDDDGAPSLSISDVTVTEGDAGTTDALFTVTLLPASGQTVSVNFATANINASAGSDYNSNSGTLTFAPGETSKAITVKVNGDTANEADEQFSVNLSGATNATLSDSLGVGTITNDDAPRLQFAQADFAADESLHFKVINVTRTGDASIPVTVDYASSDGTASQRNDYTFAFGTLRFAAGEVSKSFELLLADDAITEASAETINLALSNPTGGAILGAQSTATVTIAANDNPAPASNPIDEAGFFVRQHYHDFFGRKPDDPGLAFWTGGITSCGSDAQCREVKRIDTSAAFFLSIEFQETGYLVERIYKTSYGDAVGVSTLGEPGGRSHTLAVPIVRLSEFLPDTQRIGQGVVIGQPGANELLEANKNAFALEFVQRQRFLSAFPLTMTPAQVVDRMNANAGNVLTTPERDALVAQLTNSANVSAGRASVLRQIAETDALRNNENNAAFVLMQFFGYLRRNPNDPQDTDYTGYEFWLRKLNEFGGDFRKAEMVKAFISSDEYRQRYRQ